MGRVIKSYRWFPWTPCGSCRARPYGPLGVNVGFRGVFVPVMVRQSRVTFFRVVSASYGASIIVAVSIIADDMPITEVLSVEPILWDGVA